MFLDRSASSRVDALTRQLFHDSIQKIAAGALPCRGDRVHAYLLYAFTPGAAYRADLENNVRAARTQGVPGGQASAERARERTQTSALRRRARAALFRLADSVPIGHSHTLRTDLLGSLEVASEQLAAAPAGRPVRIYYFSDMHESMRGAGRRDFDARPPRDRAEAHRWADADVALVRGMNVDPRRLARAEIQVIMGTLSNRPTAVAVEAYWRRLFSRLGVADANIHY